MRSRRDAHVTLSRDGLVRFVGLAPEAAGKRHRAGARHRDEVAMIRDQAIGFHEGWTVVAGPWADMAETMARGPG